MPSNYGIAKTLKQIADYREICGHAPGQYGGAALELQMLRGQKLEELPNPDAAAIKAVLNEADDEVAQTILEMLQGREVAALKPGAVPLSILEITEIKGFGPKLTQRAYDELSVVDLAGLQAAASDGRLGKVKGFGPKLIEKVTAHKPKTKK